MRKLFIVVAKLMGLWQLYSAIIITIQSSFYLSSSIQLSTVDKEIFLTLGLWVLNTAFVFILAWLLIVKTEWLADKFNINDRDDSPSFNAESALQIGIKLIGVYVAVLAMPQFMRRLRYYSVSVDVTLFLCIGAFFLRLGLGFFLALKTEMIIKFISKGTMSKDGV